MLVSAGSIQTLASSFTMRRIGTKSERAKVSKCYIRRRKRSILTKQMERISLGNVFALV